MYPWQHSSTSTPTPPTRCSSGVAEVHAMLDRMHAGAGAGLAR